MFSRIAYSSIAFLASAVAFFALRLLILPVDSWLDGRISFFHTVLVINGVLLLATAALTVISLHRNARRPLGRAIIYAVAAGAIVAFGCFLILEFWIFHTGISP